MKEKELTILQLNDLHGYINSHSEYFEEGKNRIYKTVGGLSRIKTIKKDIGEKENKEVLFLDNGDTFHGTYFAVNNNGKDIIDITNNLGLSAMTAHWEFAYGPKGFKEIAERLNYPVIANNIYIEKTKEKFFPSHIIKDIGGLKVGIVGIASNIVDKTMPKHFSEGLKFTLGKDELKASVDTLKNKENVDLVVLLSHLGFPQEVALLEKVDGVDVCLSGHTHNRLYKPVIVNNTIIMQSGSHGSFLGRLDIKVKDKKISDFKHNLIEVSQDIKKDEEIQKIIDNKYKDNKEYLETVLGRTVTPLDRGGSLETTMDNFLLDAMADQTDTEISFSNGWRYGAPIERGNITVNDLYNIVPTNPEIMTTIMTGGEIYEMVEENLENTFSRDPFSQMGGYIKRSKGINVYFKAENPKETRIQELFVLGDKVDPSSKKEYKVSFITVQGVPVKFGENRKKSGIKMIDALKNYINKKEVIEINFRNSYVLV